MAQAKLAEVMAELEKLQTQEKLRNEQTRALRQRLTETLQLLEQLPSNYEEKLAQLQQELMQSDDTRLRIQQKLNEKLSECDDNLDKMEALQCRIRQYEQTAEHAQTNDVTEKIKDFEQQLIAADAQKQKLAAQLAEKVAQLDDLQDKVEELRAENAKLKASAAKE